MRILIVDDDGTQCAMLQGFLEKQGYTTLTAASGKEALGIFSTQPIHLVLLDNRMDDMNGDEVLARMRESSPLIRAIMITAYGNVKTAVKVMQLGADDFIEKPVDLSELLQKIRRIEKEVIVRTEAEKVAESVLRKDLPMDIIGSSREMQELLSMVYRVAPTEWTTLIRGETGTGKELLAKLIHIVSPRKAGPFVVVNCGAIPENLFESELFGHQKGAFTGAVSSRHGRFEMAQKGTIFFDEVGDLPLQMQVKLLRALQEKKISPVGSDKDVEIDVRVLAATNRDLKKMVAQGSFREDLFFRLNVLELIVPPLRERKGDIVELIDFFLLKYRDRPISFDVDAITQLIKYDFPGNVRELEHLVQRMVTLVRTNLIRVDDLPLEIRERQSTNGMLNERLAKVEYQMLLAALEKNDWVQTKAAESLGISERVLRYKMTKAGIKKE
jgi:two-component system, NtrC family, response regulator AtoC